jgi:DNA-binding XRE family transcriptional regulator
VLVPDDSDRYLRQCVDSPWPIDGETVGDPDTVTAARRSLGEELAAYRRAAGWTQDGLAKLTGYSRSTIANVETGRQHAPRDLWERADAELRTGGVLASGHDEIEAAARRELRAVARRASVVRKTGAVHDRQSGSLDSLAPSLPAVGLPSAPGACPQEAQPDGLHDVSRLRSMRQHLKAIDNAHGGGAALPMATWYMEHEVSPLLDEHHGHPASRSLREVVAQFRHDIGWAAYDAGQQELATRHFTSALRLAHAAGDRMLGARILAAMSHQAIYLGHVRQAIDFAQAARATTRQLATPRATAMLAAMEACAHAAAGGAHSSRRALDDAATALASIVSGETEPDWLDFDEGGYWGHAARAYRDLGQFRKAEECAAKSVGLCLAGHSRTRAQRNAIQASAHLRTGEIDAAAAVGQQVVLDAWNLHSSHVFREVMQLADAMAAFRALEAKEFLDQAHELLTARGAASLASPRS